MHYSETNYKKDLSLYWSPIKSTQFHDMFKKNRYDFFNATTGYISVRQRLCLKLPEAYVWIR